MEPQPNTGTGDNRLHAGHTIFIHFLFTNKVSKKTIVLCGLLAIVQFIVFKVLYPYASFMPDSRAYIEAAGNNAVINTWPIGYSWFLRSFGLLSRVDTVLAACQYVMLLVSGLYFIYTVFYFVRPGRIIQYILPVLFVLNPLFLVTANYVSSDALFISLSFVWATQLMWLLYKPSTTVLWLHVLVLFLAFIVRFNSLYYPFISAAVILLSKRRLSVRITATACSFILIALFGWYCSNQYKVLTGERQLAAFAGWQLAGNALYAYSHGNERIENVPAEFGVLHQMVNRHMDSLNRLQRRPDVQPGIYYQWQGPLAQYFARQYPGDADLSNFKHYASLASLYKAYGTYLIQARPAIYIKYFLWPNLVQFYAPPAEFLGRYNVKNKVNDIELQWFGYRDSALKGYSRSYAPLENMTIVSAIINIAFAGSLIGFIYLGGFKKARHWTPFLLLVTALWIANMGFSVLASPIVLRYQLFILSLIACAGISMVKFIYDNDSTERTFAPAEYVAA